MPVVLKRNVDKPTAVLFEAALQNKEFEPTATLPPPAELYLKALEPKDVLLAPVVFLKEAPKAGIVDADANDPSALSVADAVPTL